MSAHAGVDIGGYPGVWVRTWPKFGGFPKSPKGRWCIGVFQCHAFRVFSTTLRILRIPVSCTCCIFKSTSQTSLKGDSNRSLRVRIGSPLRPLPPGFLFYYCVAQTYSRRSVSAHHALSTVVLLVPGSQFSFLFVSVVVRPMCSLAPVAFEWYHTERANYGSFLASASGGQKIKTTGEKQRRASIGGKRCPAYFLSSLGGRVSTRFFSLSQRWRSCRRLLFCLFR